MFCLKGFLGFTVCSGTLCADFPKAGHQSRGTEQFAGSSENSAWATLIYGLCPHVEIKGETKCPKLLLKGVTPGENNRVFLFFPFGFVARAISNYTAKYPITLCTGNIAPQNQCYHPMINASAARCDCTDKKGKSKKQAC